MLLGVGYRSRKVRCAAADLYQRIHRDGCLGLEHTPTLANLLKVYNRSPF